VVGQDVANGDIGSFPGIHDFCLNHAGFDSFYKPKYHAIVQFFLSMDVAKSGFQGWQLNGIGL